MPWRSATRLRRAPRRLRETQNAQTEDEIGREKALPVHRQWQDQARPDAQAPWHDQALERADPRVARYPRAVGLRNPARQALDALRGLREKSHVQSPSRRCFAAPPQARLKTGQRLLRPAPE